LLSVFAVRSKFTPIVATVEAIQPKMPKYITRITASMSDYKASPKDDAKLGTGRTLMSA